jgi:hypothetical protein
MISVTVPAWDLVDKREAVCVKLQRAGVPRKLFRYLAYWFDVDAQTVTFEWQP